jgi:hypothetical protein
MDRSPEERLRCIDRDVKRPLENALRRVMMGQEAPT